LPNLGDLTIPVFIYALVSLQCYCLLLKAFWCGRNRQIGILIGAVLFVSSDSLVAFNKFYNPLVLSSFIIMITYLIAQYLIVSGILKLNQKNIL
jgi:uncharacterized membrane protein YhhN